MIEREREIDRREKRKRGGKKKKNIRKDDKKGGNDIRILKALLRGSRICR